MEKFADAKVKSSASSALLAIGESVGINVVSLRVVHCSAGHKSPKVQSESLSWLADALNDFGKRISSCLIGIYPFIVMVVAMLKIFSYEDPRTLCECKCMFVLAMLICVFLYSNS